MRPLRISVLFACLVIAAANLPLRAAASGDHAHGDAFYPPPPPPRLLSADTHHPDEYQPSAFLAGRVAVRVVFVESDGSAEPSREDWTAPQIERIIGQVGEALDWWRGQLPNARLEFELVSQLAAARHEPIQHDLRSEGIWISAALDQLGFRGANHFEQAYAAANALRRERGSDWATTIFVVNSSADPDGRFADGHFAYAYINGPFMVITSDTGMYGADGMAAIVAHELGHIFGALDQYAEAGIPCTTRSGYLSTPTTNSQAGGCGTRFLCIMREPVAAYNSNVVDSSALAQVGYRDEDGDNLPDPLDTTPALQARLEQSPDGGRPLVVGKAFDQPYASPSQQHATINTITRVEYRVDGSEWFVLPAADGAYDRADEAIRAALPLYDGAHTVELRAINSVGAASAVVRHTISVDGVGPASDYGATLPAMSNTADLAIGLRAPAGASVRISASPGAENAPWTVAQAQTTWRLDANDGAHTVYITFRDQNGLVSPMIARPTVLDRQAPTGNAVLRRGSTARLELSAQDNLSGVTELQVLLPGDQAPAWRPFQPTLALPGGASIAQVRVRDAAGNISDPLPLQSSDAVYLPLVSGP